MTTSLQIAVKNKNDHIFRFLLDHDADVDGKDADNKTAFYLVAKTGNINFMNYLLRFKPNTEDSSNKLVLRIFYLKIC